MASRYNPSKLVTELLERYIEFDPEQLKLGIWSGHLSLSNLHLRQEAIYPLLNSNQRIPQPEGAEPQLPPLRFKLVSGTIGALDIKIPWKRLVWRNGDVKVDLKQVVLVLALETRHETRQRYEDQQKNENKSETESSSSSQEEGGEQKVVTIWDDIERLTRQQQQQEGGSLTEEQQRLENPRLDRKSKQQRLATAEMRHLQGLPIGSWLSSMRKQDEQKLAEKLRDSALLADKKLEKDGTIVKMLREATQNFFWRLWAGLHINIENLKIVLVQDGVEVGLVVPKAVTISSSSARDPAGDQQSHASSDEITTSMAASIAAAPQNLDYRGAYDDGEHMDKGFQISQLGIYVRNQVNSFHAPPESPLHMPVADIHPSEFVLRPLDLEFAFSLFFPYPPDKRKKTASKQMNLTSSKESFVIEEGVSEEDDYESDDYEDDMPMVGLTLSNDSSPPKRRRNKRDKISFADETATTELMTEAHGSRSGPSLEPENLTSAKGPDHPLVRLGMNMNATPDIGKLRRRTSLASAPKELSSIKPLKRVRRVVSTPLPLAQPEHDAAGLSPSQMSVEPSSHAQQFDPCCARFEGKLTIGAVQMVLSTRHYELMSVFLAGGARLRNGRPNQTIHSVLDQGHALKRSLTVVSTSERQVRLELHSARTERSEVIASWWRYALGTVVWEMRHRRRHRLLFQERFLSFNWKQQRRHRDEYVRLFIRLRLTKREWSPLLGDSSASQEERLLSIEDDLPLEQILLYRSLARNAHVLGRTQLPDSILELQVCVVTDGAPNKIEEDGRSGSAHEAVETHAKEDGSPGRLSFLEEQCEIARLRKGCPQEEELPPYQASRDWSSMAKQRALPSDVDETTFVTALSREPRFRGRSVPEESSTMVVSFSIKIQEVELSVVEEEVFVNHYRGPLASGRSESSSHSSEQSDVSDLTDDKRFFRDEKGKPVPIAITESSGAEPATSLDYFLVGLPERTILRMILSPLHLTVAARSGEFRRVKFLMGQVKVSGGKGTDILVMGEDLETNAPMHEISLSNTSSMRSVGIPSPSSAVSLSWVQTRLGATVQCDAATVRLVVDLLTIEKVVAFTNQSSALFPSSLVGTSPRDQVRLYVLREYKHSAFSAVNASMRFYGFEMTLPAQKEVHLDDMVSSKSTSTDSSDESACVFRSDIVEIYSGNALEAIAGEDFSVEVETASRTPRNVHNFSVTQTRKLQMIDGTNFRPFTSSSCHGCVVAISGLDIIAWPKGTDTVDQLSLLQTQIDVEVLYALNSYSVFESDKAKVETIVRISPVDLVLSESRLLLMSNCLRASLVARHNLDQQITASQVALPPRLEVLSGHVIFSADISLSRFRVSILGKDYLSDPPEVFTKSLHREGIIRDFLSVVSNFDLSFPHEEALSGAMQICIDRLSGLGLSSEDAWRVANSALLNFLDEVTGARTAADRTGCTSTPEEDLELLENARQRTLGRTISKYNELLGSDDLIERMAIGDLVVDCPDGVTVSTVSLFYDSHTEFNVPTLFVLNGGGIHLLRVTPPGSVANDSNSSSSSISESKDFRSEQSQRNSNPSSKPSQFGLTFRQFSLDTQSPFGRGGLPLATLGSDSDVNEASEARAREHLYDFDAGELEFFFCRSVACDVATMLVRTFAPLLKLRSEGSFSTEAPKSNELAYSHFLGICGVASVMLGSDSFVPFSRFVLRDAAAKSSVSADLAKARNDETLAHFHASSFELINLSAESELYPTVVSALPPGQGRLCLPIVVNYRSSGLDVVLNSIRVIFLCQFLNETLQYFTSEEYGIGELREILGGLGDSDSETSQDKPSTSRCTISLVHSSILLPRSSSSPDMVAMEASCLTVDFNEVRSSFVMPTAVRVFSFGGVLDEDNVNSSDKPAEFSDCRSFPGTPVEAESDDGTGRVSRVSIGLRGVRLFTSLPETGDSEPGPDNLSFNYCYVISGRAGPDKAVYTALDTADEAGLSEVFERENTSRAQRCWREISGNEWSLDVVADYAPHLRLLLANPTSGPRTDLTLDVRLSQFCLLLSIWFSNMQELPRMFPYTGAELQSGSANASDQFDFPDFGTEALVEMLLNPLPFSSEMCIVVDRLLLRCAFDCLDDHGQLIGATPGITICFDRPVVHVTYDERGVGRIGMGSAAFSLVDESQAFEDVVVVPSTDRNPWADLSFGLVTDKGLGGGIPSQPFQLGLFMLPLWSSYNVGMHAPKVTATDLGPIFRVLEMFSSYFTDSKFGNPTLEAAVEAENLKVSLRKALNLEDGNSAVVVEDVGGTDFRLWLSSPTLSVPCDPEDRSAPGLSFRGDGGLWYRYTSFADISVQEVVSDGLSLDFRDHFMNPVERADGQTRTLIEGLSFGIRLDFNGSSGHSDYSVSIPFSSHGSCGIASPRLSVPPLVVATPTICSPVDKPHRYLGPRVCEITCIVEVLPLVSTAILTLFSGAPEDSQPDSGAGRTDTADDSVSTERSIESNQAAAQEESSPTFSLVASVGDLRFFALDPILGPHLPVAVFSVASVRVTASQFAHVPSGDNVEVGSSAPEDIQVAVESHLWADYFKLGITRSWEPLMEAYSLSVLWEKSRLRGSGMCLSSESPLHFNISGAHLVVFNQVFDVYIKLVRDTFSSDQSPSSQPASSSREPMSGPSLSVADSSGDTDLLHQKPETVEANERVAFSLKNLSGNKVRLFRSGSTLQPAVVSYLEHGRIARLSFQPSISTIRNMQIREVEFPGFSQRCDDVSSHLIDLQLPGCKWLRGLEIGYFGRSFSSLTPLSTSLQRKTAEDWRVANLFNVLIEVGLENGGRQVTVRSLFSVVNRTEHDISILCHPDPSFAQSHGNVLGARLSEANAGLEDAVLEPGESYAVPSLLLRDALTRDGNHLGSFWLKPKKACQAVDFENYPSGPSEKLRIDYSSRSVHFSRIVNESAFIFESARGQDVPSDRAKTGVQVSCPVSEVSGDRLAPFCYAVEVGRSPLVEKRDVSEAGEGEKYHHGPVSYTLSIHAPFVFVNLLPKKARFELMHAVRRTVVWFADLDAGQSIPVHSVGLDAPLLLLINLGFCRTPVGEGALVHHGTDPTPGTRDHLGGLKSIGKAGKAVTKQLGKTLTAIGESPDKRARMKMNKERTKRLSTTLKRPTLSPRSGGSDTDDVADMADGNTYRIDTSVFFPHDVSETTTVVDGLGHRLALRIENVRGGGGQRRVSVFCPFWIVNTTEHALRYKQENSKSFVAGTVVDTGVRHERAFGQRSARLYEVERPFASLTGPGSSTAECFAGTPGALASKLRRSVVPSEEIAELIDFSLPLERLAELAFMFNFHDEGISMGGQRLCIQLAAGTGSSAYQSGFSRGLSLDSVGISQMVSLHCMEGRFLELTVLVYVAPGALSNYTKIVRLLPRYVVVNMLPYPVRLWQDSSVFRSLETEHGTMGKGGTKWHYRKGAEEKHRASQYQCLWGREATLDEGFVGTIPAGTTAQKSALYISTVGTSDLVPFLLPDSRDERQLRIDIGAPWSLTASFAADVAGDHVLELTEGVDLKTLPHVSTRASPEYQVRIHPGSLTDELGVWYETEWGSSRSVIVKAVKKNSYAFNETDINVGDELLQIDGIPVARKTFADVMKVLRDRLHEISASNIEGGRKMKRSTMRLVGRSQTSRENVTVAAPLLLTFRTAEERLRRVRLKAARAAGRGIRSRSSLPLTQGTRVNENESLIDSSKDISSKHIRAELKTLHHMMFLVLREEDSPPFLIQNRTISGIIYFRQKGCASHSWRALKPEQSTPYTWQEPLKLKRLSVRVAPETAYGLVHEDRSNKKARSEDEAAFSATVNVKIEEIGCTEYLLSRTAGEDEQKWYKLEVDVSGATRILVIRDVSKHNEQVPLTKHFDFLRKNIAEEEIRLSELGKLSREVMARAESDLEPVDKGMDFVRDVEETAKGLTQDLSVGPSIGARHQVFVQVIEALNLNTDSFVGDCNPYAAVVLNSGLARRRTLFRKVDTRRTYYVKKSVNPTWESQSFIFDVPPSAVEVPRGHSITVRLRSYRTLGQDNRLGKAQVDLHSLRNQEPLVGWFPLAGRTGRRELENQLSHWGRGSVKLRLQWIYSVPALLDYFTILSEARLADLQTRLERLEEHARARELAEQQEKNEIDGFKLVRIQDFLSFSKGKLHLGSLKDQLKNDVKLLSRPFLPAKRNEVEAIVPKQSSERRKSPYAALSAGNARRVGAKGRSLLDSVQETESQWPRNEQMLSPQFIDRSRHRMFSNELSSRPLDEKRVYSSHRDLASVEVPVTAVASWNFAQALFNDKEIETSLEGNVIVAQIRPMSPRPRKRPRNEHEVPLAEKMELPHCSPSPLEEFAKKQIDLFSESRTAFERTARRSLSTILHPGGWLTIRPIRAMNLPDNYSGMFVRLRYGSEVLITDSVDARVAPRWSSSSAERHLGSTVPEDPTRSTGQSNDLHIHVTPQRTNGLIRLSVVGERSQQQLQARTELGTLCIPLGSAIAACIDCEMTSSSSALHYRRWFPLLRPSDSVPVEGDGGLSFRAPDSEKQDERSFKDYYMPCIELALIWHPDDDNGGFEDEHVDEGSNEIAPSDYQGRTVNLYFNADLASISAALLDSERNFELLSFNAMDFDVRFWITDIKTRMGVSIRWLQLDHQDEEAREPIVLAPTPNDNLFPVFHVFAVKDNLRSTEVVTFDFIDVSIAEFDLTIEESFLFDLVVFINSVLIRRGIDRISRSDQIGHGIKQASDFMTDEPSLSSLLEEGFKVEQSSENKVYIEQLFLGVVKFNLSYVKGTRRYNWESPLERGWSDTVNDPTRFFQQIAVASGENVRGQFGLQHRASNVFVEWSRQTSDEVRRAEDSDKTLQNLPKLISALFPNLSDAPVRLQSKALNHVFESPTEILHSLKSFYVNETLKQVYKIVGSLDFVGNPTMLVASFFSGFRDLLVTPSEAFRESPTDPSSVGLGFAKGTLSLVAHSTSGFFAFCSRVSATAGQAIATLSMDADFRDWHRSRIVVETTNLNRQWKRRGMQSVQAMIARPVGDLVLGLVGGAFGIVLSPIKGYRRDGGRGLAQGLAVGCIGVFARPAVGALDAFAHFTASIHDIAKSVNVLDRRLQPATRIRLPYTFGFMNVLMPFDDSLARADFLLRRYPLEKSFKSSLEIPETIVHVEVLPNNAVVAYAIATTARVILIRVKKELSGDLIPSLCWQLCFASEAVVSSRVADHGHSGVALTITLAKPSESTNEAVETPRSVSDTSFRLPHGFSSASKISDITSSDRPVVDAGKEFDHHTGRGVKGEKLEWFTVLAEYQYRRQLERLHNSICSVVGDFDAILRDPSLSHRRGQGTEGYTSFGIYHFTPTDSSDVSSQTSERGPPVSLERLPWVGERIFREAATKQLDQQKTALEDMRRWGLADYIEASREEGGPEWLVVARANTAFADTKELTGTDIFSFSEGILLNEAESDSGASEPTNRSLTEPESRPSLTPFGTRPRLRRAVSWTKKNTALRSPYGRKPFLVRNEGPLQIQTRSDSALTPEVSAPFTTPRSFLSDSSTPTQGGKADVFVTTKQFASSDITPPFLELADRSGAETMDGVVRSVPQRPSGRNVFLNDPTTQKSQSSNEGPTQAPLGMSADDSSRINGERLGSIEREDDSFVSARQIGSSGRKSLLSVGSEGLLSANQIGSSRSSLPSVGSKGMPPIVEASALSSDSAAAGMDEAQPSDGVDCDREDTQPTGTVGDGEDEGKNVAQKSAPGSQPSFAAGQVPGGDRLGRMEALMESLMVFSTEQALRREQQTAAPQVHPTENEVALLRQEISDLREELNHRAGAGVNASEIAALREDISWLRANFGSSGTDGNLHRDPTPAPDFEQAGNVERQQGHVEDVD